jgi:hypothetical protein
VADIRKWAVNRQSLKRQGNLRVYEDERHSVVQTLYVGVCYGVVVCRGKPKYSDADRGRRRSLNSSETVR